jgi:hypothetical protein
VSSIGDLELAVVVGLPGLAGPLSLDGGQNSAVVHDTEDVGHGLRRPSAEGGEDTWVRAVEVAI